MVAIIAILIAILLPGLSAARERTRRVVCASNLRQIAAAWTMYMQETADIVRPAGCNGRWYYGGRDNAYDSVRYGGCVLERRPVNLYVAVDERAPDVAEIYHCPNDRGAVGLLYPESVDRPSYEFWGNSYPLNASLVSGNDRRPVTLTSVRLPASLVVLNGDHQFFWTAWGVRQYSAIWHDKAGLEMNLAFLDGHAAFTRMEWGEPHTGRYSLRLDPPPEEAEE